MTEDQNKVLALKMLTLPSPTVEHHSSHQEKIKDITTTLEDICHRWKCHKSRNFVLSHFFFCVNIVNMGGLFQNMFPDSAIAKNFACGRTKMNYLICFGIGPYFREKVLQKIKDAEFLTISFDESLNKDFQTEQMDIIVHYFHEDRVVTQYFNSQLHEYAQLLVICLKSLKCSFSKLNNRKTTPDIHGWIKS